MYLPTEKSYPYPPSFRAPRGERRKPVAGGRWQVRRYKGEWPWRAWTTGKNRRWNKKFKTHAEAIAWAHARATGN